MNVNQKLTGRASSMPAGLFVGSVVSLTVTIAISTLLAKLIDTEKIAWESAGYGVMVLLLLASFMGAVAAYGKVKRQRLIVCAASGAVYFLILMGITALFFGGQYEAVGVTAALILAGSMAAGLLGIQGRNRKKGKKIKIPRC